LLAGDTVGAALRVALPDTEKAAVLSDVALKHWGCSLLTAASNSSKRVWIPLPGSSTDAVGFIQERAVVEIENTTAQQLLGQVADLAPHPIPEFTRQYLLWECGSCT
jgi:hypothetical protein